VIGFELFIFIIIFFSIKPSKCIKLNPKIIKLKSNLSKTIKIIITTPKKDGRKMSKRVEVYGFEN